MKKNKKTNLCHRKKASTGIHSSIKRDKKYKKELIKTEIPVALPSSPFDACDHRCTRQHTHH